MTRLFDELAPVYDQSGVEFAKPIANRLIQLLDPQRGEHALDVGCGRGAATFPLADAVGPNGHVTAIDVSQAMVDLTSEQVRSTGRPWVDVRRMDATAPDVAGFFDIVASSLVLFFLPDPRAAVESWLRLLKPGGRLGVTTFGARDPVWQSVMEVFTPYLPPDLLDAALNRTRGPLASESSLSELLKEAGAAEVTTLTEPVTVLLPDAEAWRAWSMTQGQRGMWMTVPQSSRDEVFQQAAALLESARSDDGIRLTTDVRYTVART